MVREGQMAKVTACKEAEVKRPISGKFQVPTEEVLSGTMAKVRKVKQAKKVVSPRVEDGEASAKKVALAHVEDGEAGAGKVSLAHVEDGEAGAGKVTLAHVEDGEAGAGKVSLAHVEDGEAGARNVLSQGRVLQALPEMADEKSSIVQDRQTQVAYSDLTLSQLFTMKDERL